MWWRDAVIYQYLPPLVSGLERRRDRGPAWICRVWTTSSASGQCDLVVAVPPVSNADFGYDVADYTAVDPYYGTLEDFDRLVAAAHERGLRVIVDFVPCHTSIEHPWFRERPDFYHWADAPVNNWLARFGGSAWGARPPHRALLPAIVLSQQPDPNRRNPDVRVEMQSALRFWLERGVDGFRLDAIVRLFGYPESVTIRPPASRSGCLCPRNTEASATSTPPMHPSIGVALRAIREAVGDALLIGEAYLPTAQLRPYTEIRRPLNRGDERGPRRGYDDRGGDRGRQAGWVLSNHDFARFATRFGENFRAACVLFLSLPGPGVRADDRGRRAGTPDGPGVDPALDRNQRDPLRHPMQWNESRPVASPPGSRGCRPTSRSYGRGRPGAGRGGPRSRSSGASSVCVATLRQGHGCWTRRPEPWCSSEAGIL